MKHLNKFTTVFSLALALSFLLTACANHEQFVQTATTDDYTQDLNPPYVDILWMVSDRSTMNGALPSLLPEYTSFFKRLDGTAQSYQMAFASADMQIRPAQLRPIGSNGKPLIKETRSNNTVEDRAAYFKDILNRYINLSTGGEERGLESVIAILNGPFVPRPNVPLVVVFISDAFDISQGVPSGVDPVDYYEQKLLALKGGNRNLIRVYSINYKPLLPGETVNPSTRCAWEINANVDTRPQSLERYFKLAKRFAVDLPNPDAVTGTLCKPFASQIDVTGLRMKEFAKRFSLKARPKTGTLQVTVFLAGSDTIYDTKWTYDAATNEVVFDTAPPEGSNIRISYFPG